MKKNQKKNCDRKNIVSTFEEKMKKDLKSTRNYKKVDELYLQRRIERPGVLLEVGFLSNSNDRYLLKQDSYQNRIVTSITNGLLKYFSA